MRLILTWGAKPSDLDVRVKFFDSNGNVLCKLFWNNRKCEDYATLDVDETNGGINGPETITIKNIHDGVTAMYYVYDYSDEIGTTMSWTDSEAQATIFGPNGGGSTVVPLEDDKLDKERYFIVGCFDSTGFPGFQKVGTPATEAKFSNCVAP